jgi:ketosteroid isomerase-like protein
MSQENVERLRAVYAEWATGNFRAGGELFAPDVVFEPAERITVAGGARLADGRSSVFLGRDAIAEYMREFLAQWSDFRIDAEEFVEAGDTIIVAERQHGTGKASGVETQMTLSSVWTFRDGLVVRVRWVSERERALEAAGLSE